MKIIFILFIAFNAFGSENSQNCYCPTCPNNIRKCSNTGNSYTRNPSNDKKIVSQKKTSKKQAKAISQ